MSKNIKYRQLITQKLNTYYEETPTAVKCIKYLMEKYPYIMPSIDHTAYRNLSKHNLYNFEYDMDTKYECKGKLDFPLKEGDRYHKHAQWYNHPVYSRLFSSYIDISESDLVMIDKIWMSELTLQQKYNKLKEIDQYMAWTMVWGDSINHIAIDLSNYHESFVNIIDNMIKDLDLSMNIFSNNLDRPYLMVSQDKLLRQCSTKSDLVDGIPKAYIEFVHRDKDPNTNIQRDGFDTFSANNIFESTN